MVRLYISSLDTNLPIFFPNRDIMVEQSLAGRVALVSGSAWSIGAAVCVELASK